MFGLPLNHDEIPSDRTYPQSASAWPVHAASMIPPRDPDDDDDEDEDENRDDKSEKDEPAVIRGPDE
jgi:hypothetical protein